MDVEWTRGGGGCQCRRCTSYLQWNYPTAEDKSKLAKEIESGGTERQKRFREEQDGNASEDGSRRPKKAKKSTRRRKVSGWRAR